MNPTRSTFRHNSDSRPACNEDHNTHSVSHSKTEEEKQRRREEWLRQQERDRQHEKLKEQKIREYERKRAESLKYTDKIEQKLPRHSHSRNKSDSKSPLHHLYRGKSTSTASKSNTLFEKLDGSANGAMPLFKGAQDKQISVMELRRIKVDIRRNIPTKGPVAELKRNILNPEDVVLKRREGEGCKPIFDREEIKTTIIKPDEVDEQRTVVAIDGEQPVSNNKSRTSKKRSSSLSPIRNRSYSPGYPPPYQSRYDTNSKRHNSKTEYRDHHKNDGRSSVEKHKEYKAKYTERDSTNRSRSRERDPRSSRSRPFMEERSHRDRYRGRSSEHSHERRDRNRDRDRDKSMERRNVAPHYIEPVHMPIYCDFPPRPIVVSPVISFRGQVPPMGRGRHPALIGPIRPFPPRFVPPDMYRLGPPPPNPRYGPF